MHHDPTGASGESARPHKMKTFRILNLGAGVQSTALYLMSLRGDEPLYVPPYDYAIFADTQEEPDEVYRHLEWLESLGGPPILRRTFGKLGDDLIYGHHQVLRKDGAKYRAGQMVGQFYGIPAFVADPTGKPGGLVFRKCTGAYKVKVLERCIREDILGLKPNQRFPADVSVSQHLGLSFDEPDRVAKTRNLAHLHNWFQPVFPLFDLEYSRSDCIDYLRSVVPHSVPRSACTFCPYHSNEEWRRLRDSDPKGWQRACEIDEGIRSPDAACAQDLEGTLYLHRSCVPLREAPIDSASPRGSGVRQECHGMCGL